ncbi:MULTISPECIES: SecY-interacting protein [unclassified Pantoea]|jgi:SecY interacting protein Syd|uniref:SecY-interacting protein n=1 Tax=unclassified Pantoea TaxID=2630326 RepID=UPI0010C9AA34|nr:MULTISPECIES: SecY-interacting protein [unclassified Pantoea]QCP60619.1 SecY-interacting protein [Pantoea sp. SO10]WGK56443.1 SecY-interacting protein [Pantoea sp. SS70]
MMQQTVDALREFTARYVEHWQQQTGHFPASADLLGVPSDCIISTLDDRVLWQPQPFTLPATLEAVERALDLQLQPEISAFYTSQFAGDMTATFEQQPITLLQVWSEADFTRLQENLIGHLVMKRRLRQAPTLFIATTNSENEVIALCNLTGEVIIEEPGTKKREVLATSVENFLNALQPVTQ